MELKKQIGFVFYLHFVDGIPTKTNPLPTMDMVCSTKRQNT